MKNINIKNYIKLFSNLTPEKIKLFDDLIDENIIFIDPFNNIKGSNEFKKFFIICLRVLKILNF